MMFQAKLHGVVRLWVRKVFFFHELVSTVILQGIDQMLLTSGLVMEEA